MSEQRYNETLVSGRKDGKLANSDNIFDKDRGKMQSDINKEMKTRTDNSFDSLKQTKQSVEDGGENVITLTRHDGTSEKVKFYNGSKGSKGDKGDKGDKGNKGEVGMQGNSGIADASNKTLVNDAITGGETDFLSAEVGKLGILTYDCSKGGSVTHATLQDAINSVPTTFQKVGLTITYKSGNTIYSYTLKANTWSADPANWFSVEDKLNDLSSFISNFMPYPYSNIFEDFTVFASTKYDFYLRKMTKQAITIGYISDNETHTFIETKINKDGSFSQLSINGVYIHGKVNVNNIKEENSSVLDMEAAKARRIHYYQEPKKSVIGSNPILDLVFDEIYLERDIDKTLYLRNATQTNISLGTELNGVTNAIDLKRIKYQVVSIGNAKAYIVLSDDFIKGNYDWMNIRGSMPEYYKFDVDVIRNIEYAPYIKSIQSSKETNAMYDFSENEDSISLFTRILNSRKVKKEIEENKMFSHDGSDASFCLDDTCIYIAHVVGEKSNDVYYGEGAEVELIIKSKSDSSEIKTIQIAKKDMVITLDDGKEVTLQRGASMPNIIREGTNIYILYCTMIGNLFVLMRCCVDSVNKTISSYSVCKLNGEDFNTSSIKKCGGIYSTDYDVSINVNARFADSKDVEGNYYVGVCAADKLTYPLIAKTKDFKSFSSFMFLECRNMNAAYECTTAFRENDNKLYAVTRQAKLNDGYKYLILNSIDIKKKEILSTRNISASDSRPCLFLHRNGTVLLAYNLPNARNRVRIVHVEQSGDSSILLDFSYIIAGYINFERSMSEVKYYCNGAIEFDNGQGGEVFSFTSLDTIKKEKTESVIDTLIKEL
jgi:hypothetical protein